MATALSRTYPAPYQTVFDATMRAVPSLKMQVGVADPAQGVINASSGVSALSWGENITIRLGATDNSTTTVSVESGSKFGFTWGKNQRNVEKLFAAIEMVLQSGPPTG